MPPLQDNTLLATHSPLDDPTVTRRSSHRTSAIVPRELLLASQLGLLVPAPEEPCGVCLYAHDSFFTQDEEMTIQTTSNAFKVQSTATGGGNSPRMEPLPVTRRSGKRREARNSVQIMESTTSPCAWMACLDNNSCTIS